MDGEKRPAWHYGVNFLDGVVEQIEFEVVPGDEPDHIGLPVVDECCCDSVWAESLVSAEDARRIVAEELRTLRDKYARGLEIMGESD